MKTHIKYAFMLALCITSVVTLSVSASASPEYILTSTYIDEVTQPKNVNDIARECLSNSACNAAASAVADYFGAPPGTVTAIKTIVKIDPVSTSTDKYIHVLSPPGYKYCRSRLSTISMVGSSWHALSMSTPLDGINVFIHVPQRGTGNGRTWVEAQIDLLSVRKDIWQAAYNSGRCHNPDTWLLRCPDSNCPQVVD